jgi:hypothetical protein
VYGSAAEALAGARDAAGSAGVVLGCGSLYLVGELVSALAGQRVSPMPSEKLDGAARSGPENGRDGKA